MIMSYHCESYILFLQFVLILFLISGLQNVMVHHLSTDAYVCVSLIQQGLMPCAPYSPTTAITIRALELFCLTHLRCPHVTVHSFLKTLCDMHCVSFKRTLLCQFTIAFNLYLSIRTAVDRLVQVSLGHDGADYHIKNLCPSCTYTLEGEAKLKFSMLYTTDGNDSMKRIIQWETVPEAPATSEGMTQPILGL
jgi:hypothetical protein